MINLVILTSSLIHLLPSQSPHTQVLQTTSNPNPLKFSTAMALSSLFIILPVPKVPYSNYSRRLLTARASSDAPAASASFDLRRY
jgi:hypothetical protein